MDRVSYIFPCQGTGSSVTLLGLIKVLKIAVSLSISSPLSALVPNPGIDIFYVITLHLI